jgi:hypothetical protein
LPPVTLFFCESARRAVIKSFRFLSHNPATDEPLEQSQLGMVLRGHEANRITDRLRTTRSTDSVDVILRMHWEIVIHHVRNAIYIDAAGGDIGGNEHTYRTGLEILQRAQALILRTVRMNRPGHDSAGLKLARDSISSSLGSRKDKHRVELGIC